MVSGVIERRRGAIMVGLSVSLVLLPSLLSGQERSRALRPLSVLERRALLIGNAEYEGGVSRLQKTVLDVQALGGALRTLGFEVTERTNLSERGMNEAVRSFKAELDPGDLAFFYYSGHGVEVDGTNYLIPVDFDGRSEAEEVKYGATPVNLIQDQLRGSGAKVRVLVLDACRDNPWNKGPGARTMGGGREFAPMQAAGDLIVYGTGAGERAYEPEDGDLGLYMTYLLPELSRERVELKEAFDRTRALVNEDAVARGLNQRPAYYDDLIGKVYLRGEPGPGGGTVEVPTNDRADVGSALEREERKASDLLAQASRLLASADGMEVREAKLAMLREVRMQLAGITHGLSQTATAKRLNGGETVGRISLQGIEERIATLESLPPMSQEDRGRDREQGRPSPTPALGDDLSPRELQEQFVEAVRGSDAARVRLLLESGVDVNAILTPERETALHVAESVEVVEALLEAGADPDTTTGEQKPTPLHKTGSAAVAQLLLDAGADPNARDEDGGTPLHRIANSDETNSNLEKMSALLRAGASPNSIRGNYHTPLSQALESDKFRFANLLLDAGADPNLKWEGGYALLHANLGTEAIQFLLDAGANPRVRNDFGETPLHTHARFGNGLTIEKLVRSGAHLEDRDEDGETPLYGAVHHENLETARALLAEGADPNSKDSVGDTPLRGIQGGAAREMVEALIDAGADPNTTNSYGVTPLRWAAFHCEPEAFQALLDNGATPMLDLEDVRCHAIGRGEMRQRIVDAHLRATRHRPQGREGR